MSPTPAANLTYARGDILKSEATWIVIPVNCVGTPGAGLAKQAAARWPAAFDRYRDLCRLRTMRPGACSLASAGRGRYVVMFPSKDHWRNPSTLDLIAAGLCSLENLARAHQPLSIAIPPVGCGLGGLDWKHVEPLITRMQLPEPTRLIIYQP